MAVNFPSGIFPTQEQWALSENVQTFQSPFNRSTQNALLSGAQWRCSMPFTNLTAEKGRRLTGFLASLKGQTGEVFVTPYDARTPLGNPSGSPTVNGSDQTGSSLATTGWPADTTVLQIGDYFEVNGELKIITADAVTNGAGDVTLFFEPSLHKSPPNAAQVVWNNPSCTMRLVNSEQASWQLTQTRHYLVSLNFEEAL